MGSPVAHRLLSRRPTRTLALSACLLLPACLAGDPSDLGADRGEIEISVAPPPEVNCLVVHLEDQDGDLRDYPVDLAAHLTLPDIVVGTYWVTAGAYAADGCWNLPARPPWSTVMPTPLIVTRAGATLSLRLYRVGGVGVDAEFVETPEVVAHGQPGIALIAADGNRLAWTTRPGSDTEGTVVTLVDDVDVTGVATTVVAGVQRPGDLGFDAAGALLWASNQRPGAPATGVIHRWQPDAGDVVIAAGEAPGELAVGGGRVYWNAIGTDEIRVALVGGGPGAPIAGQPGNNSLLLDRLGRGRHVGDLARAARRRCHRAGLPAGGGAPARDLADRGRRWVRLLRERWWAVSTPERRWHGAAHPGRRHPRLCADPLGRPCVDLLDRSRAGRPGVAAAAGLTSTAVKQSADADRSDYDPPE